MAEGNKSLAEVNNLLLQQLYDGIGNTTNSSQLLEFTEAVAKLNASFRNNDQVSDKEIDHTDQEINEAFSACQEAIITDDID